MSKKTRNWIIGLNVGLLFLCALSVGGGMLFYNMMNGQDLGLGGDAVALIKVEGAIEAGDAPPDVFGSTTSGAYSERIVRQLKEANDDPAVKAIVLRVDSPGGGVVASDEIYEQVAAIEKPVLVSMGTMAASGGYYVSAPADEIWANPNTLTGSIGVISQFINVEGLIDEYGVDVTTIKSGANKDIGSMYREMTAEEQAIWQSIVDECYDGFVKIIVEGRGLDEQTVRNLADGRVYTGQQALKLGLVDNLGNIDQVIDRAAELGGIQGEPRLIDYDTDAPLFSSLWGAFNQPSPVEELQDLLHLKTGATLMYLYTGN